MTPVLENERTTEGSSETDKAEEVTDADKPVEIIYGMMTLKAINPSDGSDIKASFAVYNQDNEKVMGTDDVSETSYRLPVGQYKVESILNLSLIHI